MDSDRGSAKSEGRRECGAVGQKLGDVLRAVPWLLIEGFSELTETYQERF